MKALALHLDHLVRADDAPRGLIGESELVERAKSDPEAFGELFEFYYEKILTYAYRCTLNLAVAEELTSNTFFSALRGLSKFRHRHRLGFSKWLYWIATNEIRMHWRREAKRPTVSLRWGLCEAMERTRFGAAEADTEEVHRDKMRMFSRLHKAVAQLPQRYRSAIILRFFEGLAYEEVGAVLGKRTGTVKSLVHRGVRRLRIILEKDATFADWPHLNG